MFIFNTSYKKKAGYHLLITCFCSFIKNNITYFPILHYAYLQFQGKPYGKHNNYKDRKVFVLSLDYSDIREVMVCNQDAHIFR